MKKYLFLGVVFGAMIFTFIKETGTSVSFKDTANRLTPDFITRLPLSEIKQNLRSVSFKTSGSTAFEVAINYLNSHITEWKLQPYHEFKPLEFHTPLGTKVKFSVYQEQIPIVGMAIQIDVGRDLSVISIQNSYKPIARADTSLPPVDMEEFLKGNEERYEKDEKSSLLPSPVLFIRPGSNEPELAFMLSVKDKGQGLKSVQILFRASDGQVLAKNFSRSEFSDR